MTFQELQDRAAELASFDGWTNDPFAPDWAGLVNRAWKQFSMDAQLLTGTVTVAGTSGTSIYATTPVVKRPLSVSWGGVGLFGSSPEYERFLSPQWRIRTGTPARWIQEGSSRVAVVPVPNANGSLVVYGVLEGQNMSASTDKPGMVSGSGNPIPDSLHEAIALLAAILQGKVAMQGESSARMERYQQEYQAFCQTALSDNGRMDRPTETA